MLISGGGRTLLNLQDHIDRAELSATIPLVIASDPCPGVERARERGLHVVLEPGVIPAPRLLNLLQDYAIDLVVLAGYLKIVNIPAPYEGRVVNIHPALLPRHGGVGLYGRRVHESVLAGGDTVSGCTVHLCDATFDTGPTLLQLTCPVLPDDTPDSLAARVFEVECRAYPMALRTLLKKLPPLPRV